MSEEKSLFPVGIKRTKQRECVYSILKEAKKPVSAVEIYEEIEKRGVITPFALSTVYRILSTFVEYGLISKNTIFDQETAVYELNGQTHKHYAVCMGCHKMVALDECPLHGFEPKISDEKFQVVGHKVELYGYCQECTNKEKFK